MENLNDIPAVKAILAPAFKRKPLSYEKLLRRMSNAQLKSELKKQNKLETARSNGEGIILGCVLNILLDGHKRGLAPFLR